TLTWWEGLLLGLVQGLSEFLPISSSGHLVVAEGLLGYRSPGVAFEVLLHVATLASVLIVYWRRVTSVLAGMARGDGPSWRFAGLLAVGSVPAGVVGFAFHDFFERYFHSYLLVGLSFTLTGVVLWSTRWVRTQATRDEVSLRNAVIIGLAQAVAIFPGISRSGTTITAALWGRVAPYPAAEFSFLLSVIAIAGSGVLEAAGAGASLGTVGAGHAWAFGGALVSGVMAIRFLVSLLRRGVFHRFAPYCLGIGIFTLIWFVALSGS
ncbi:MAG: undecaprenyl-diphosphate phosphatase, partial [Gemmatimonadales bacterium]|nr:undecaprenyl-diphosphate phosphatase [Gemmatimonadales bacterium]